MAVLGAMLPVEAIKDARDGIIVEGTVWDLDAQLIA
jgi:hypothetical protein